MEQANTTLEEVLEGRQVVNMVELDYLVVKACMVKILVRQVQKWGVLVKAALKPKEISKSILEIWTQM